MKVVLSVVVRADTGEGTDARSDRLELAVRRAHSLVGFSFPADPGTVKHEGWLDPATGVAHLAWTNEEMSPLTAADRAGALTIVGYTGSPLDFAPSASPSPALPTIAAAASGCFAAFRARPGSVEAATDATRSSPVLVAETPHLRLLGSRSLLVHLLAQADTFGTDSPRPDYDLVGLRHLANAGHFLYGLTAFRGVRALGLHEHILLDPWFIRSRNYGGDPEPLGAVLDGDVVDPEAVSSVATALVDAFDAVPGEDISLSLTGGRDSRLLAAALSRRGDRTIHTSTRGMADDPDVVLAGRLAAMMGVPHTITPPAGVSASGTIHAEDPLSRIVRALDVHDAMTSGWDDIEDYGPMMPTPRLSGVGGEVMRGGLVLPHLDELDSAALHQQLRNTLTGGHVFRDRYTESASALAAPILDLALVDPHRASDDYYLEHRNGRWVAARRAGARFRRHSYDPLLDNKFIHRVRGVPARTRWQERLAFEVIRELCPPMADLPLEGARWRFERAAPMGSASPAERAAWSDRYALTRSASTATWSWQRLDHQLARRRVTEIIMDGARSGPAADLFHPQGLERLLTPERLTYPTVVWHVATTAVLLSTPWWKTVRPPRTVGMLLSPPASITAH